MGAGQILDEIMKQRLTCGICKKVCPIEHIRIENGDSFCDDCLEKVKEKDSLNRLDRVID